MVDYVLQLFSGIPPELTVLGLSAFPIIESRGAVPVGLGIYQFSILKTVLLVFLGNMVPAFLILFGWEKIFLRLCGLSAGLGKVCQKWQDKTQRQWNASIEKYGPWALVLFVAVPLPGSGVWSGALAAWIFQINKRNALAAILAGLLLSIILLIVLTKTGIGLFTHSV